MKYSNHESIVEWVKYEASGYVYKKVLPFSGNAPCAVIFLWMNRTILIYTPSAV